MREITVGKNEAGQRLKKFCFYYFKGVPQSFTFKMLRKKNILLNDKKATGDEILTEGDRVQLYFSESAFEELRKEAETKKKLPKLSDYPWFTEKTVLYEDPDIIVLDKPFGVLTQKGTAKDRSVNDALIAYLLDKKEVTEESLSTFRPSVWTAIPAVSLRHPSPNRAQESCSGCLVKPTDVPRRRSILRWSTENVP